MAVYNNLPTPAGGIETLLWENPSPSSNLASGFQTALSDPTVFDKYRVVWQMTTKADGNEMQIDYKRLDSQASADGKTWSWSLACTIVAGDSVAYTRRISVDNSTRFWIGAAEKNNVSGSNNSHIIPLRIYGLR